MPPTIESVFQSHTFTQGLAGSQTAKLAALAAEVHFAAHEVILAEGSRSEDFYLLLTGSVSVELCTPQISVRVQALGPGEAFGWSSLLGCADTLFRVRAREDTTVVRFNGGKLAELCRRDPGFGTEFLLRTLGVVANRIRATEVKFAELCGIRV